MNGEISRESYVISRTKIEEVYLGRHETSSHVILALASGLVPKKVGGESEGFKQDRGIYSYGYDGFFRHPENLRGYRTQFKEKFGDKVPLAVISKRDIRIFKPNGIFPFVVENGDLPSIFNGWSFNRRYSMDREFLQIAHVYSDDGMGYLTNQAIFGFLLSNPLGTLEERSTYKGARTGEKELEGVDRFLLENH